MTATVNSHDLSCPKCGNDEEISIERMDTCCGTAKCVRCEYRWMFYPPMPLCTASLLNRRPRRAT